MAARGDTHLIMQVAKRLSSDNRAINIFCELLPRSPASLENQTPTCVKRIHPAHHSSTTCRDRWQVDISGREHWHQVVFPASHETPAMKRR